MRAKKVCWYCQVDQKKRTLKKFGKDYFHPNCYEHFFRVRLFYNLDKGEKYYDRDKPKAGKKVGENFAKVIKKLNQEIKEKQSELTYITSNKS